jgi:hypothetical protein
MFAVVVPHSRVTDDAAETLMTENEMKRLPSILGAVAVAATLAACSESPTQLDPQNAAVTLGTPGTCPVGWELVTTKATGWDKNRNGYLCAMWDTSKSNRWTRVYQDDQI